MAISDSLKVQIRGPEEPSSTTFGSASDYVPSGSAGPADSDYVPSTSAGPTERGQAGDEDDTVSGGVIAVAVIGSLVGIALLALLAWFLLRRRRRDRDFTTVGSPRSDTETIYAPQNPTSSVSAPEGFARFLPSETQGNSTSSPSTQDFSSFQPSAAAESTVPPTTLAINNPDSSFHAALLEHQQAHGTSSLSTAPQAAATSAPQAVPEPPPLYSQRMSAAPKGSFAEQSDPQHFTQ